MFKTLISSATLITTAGIASAQPLPAPPTQAYSPPAVSNCANETLQVYFPAGTSALTPASRATLKAAQARLDGCILGQVSLNASAADARSDAEAESLTTARIKTVSSALAKYQLDGMQVQAASEVTEPASSLRSPMDRKVEIRLAAWSPEIS
ncbi:MAG: hypothetical protein K0U61_03600 [Alphaproteobacteria bacterium]|nr:hypothetical protein [Alphaproteobacteria bacterium]